MELDSRRNEVKDEFKHYDIKMEVRSQHYSQDLTFMFLQDMLSKGLVEISELRTLVEEAKWHNMRRAISMGHTLVSFKCINNLQCPFSPSLV